MECIDPLCYWLEEACGSSFLGKHEGDFFIFFPSCIVEHPDFLTPIFAIQKESPKSIANGRLLDVHVKGHLTGPRGNVGQWHGEVPGKCLKT